MRKENRYEYLFPDEIEEIRQQTPLCYMPFGSMAWHNTHTPLGADSLIAHELGLRLARKTGELFCRFFHGRFMAVMIPKGLAG